MGSFSSILTNFVHRKSSKIKGIVFSERGLIKGHNCIIYESHLSLMLTCNCLHVSSYLLVIRLTSASRWRTSILKYNDTVFIYFILVWLGLWCLMPHSTIFQVHLYIVAVSFIGGGNHSIRRKPLTCSKSLTNFIP